MISGSTSQPAARGRGVPQAGDWGDAVMGCGVEGCPEVTLPGWGGWGRGSLGEDGRRRLCWAQRFLAEER